MERKDDARRLLYKNIPLPSHLDALRYCGPLNIRQGSVPMTYANAANVDQAKKPPPPKRFGFSVADRCKDANRLRSIASKRPSAEILASDNRVVLASSSRKDARRR